jgi:hypothetical protein
MVRRIDATRETVNVERRPFRMRFTAAPRLVAFSTDFPPRAAPLFCASLQVYYASPT